MKLFENLLLRSQHKTDPSDHSIVDLMEKHILEEYKNLEKLNAILREMEMPYHSSCYQRLLDSVKPFLLQYLKLVEFILSLAITTQRTLGKEIYIILDLFTNLCKDGFCLPPETSSSSSEGIDTSEISATGISEGEGREDVSKNITNEDQVEDAMKEGEEQPVDEKECKNEEDGIDMQGDFDGKNYDVDVDQQENDDDDNARDEMGENDDAGQEYDKKLWEDDEDGSNEESDLENGETKGQGESLGEETLSAREGLKENQDEKKENDQNQESQEIDKINENPLDDEYDGEHPDKYKSIDDKINDDQQQGDDSIMPENLDLDEGDGESDLGSLEEKEEEEQKEELPSGDEMETDVGNTEDMFSEEEIEEDDNFEDIKQPEKIEEVSPEKSDEQTEGMTDTDFTQDLKRSNQPEAIPSDNHKTRDNASSLSEPNPDLNHKPEDASQEQEDLEQQRTGGVDDGGQNEGLQTQQHSRTSIDAGQSKQQSMSRLQELKNSKRSLAPETSRPRKRQHIIPNVEDISHDVMKPDKEVIESKSVQHVNDDKKADDVVMDVAVDESDKKVKPSEEQTGSKLTEDDEVIEDDEILEPGKTLKQEAEKKALNEKEKTKTSKDSNEEVTDVEMVLEGDIIQTSSVSRGEDSLFHSQPQLLKGSGDMSWITSLSSVSLFTGPGTCSVEEAATIWNECSRVVAPLVYQLCQQLELVLEPTKSSKLKGDFRTGKRINMRKVIAYIASQFRKDKIWMRRSKPSKRNYQIILAVDDSQSMSDNQSKMMAFESFALLSKSLSLIEAGQLAVMSFGEESRLLLPLSNHFSDSSAVQVLTGFSFSQKKTRIASLLESVTSLFLKQRNSSSSGQISQLLLIISDGRGIQSEGEETVTRMVRRFNDAAIFSVFIILDNAKNSQSIFDIQTVTFERGSCVRTPYMDKFPFPFYVVLRDITSMPHILGESLRQWFQLVTQE